MLDDTFAVGGGAEGLLAFRALPPSAEILRAVLVLTPHPRQARLDDRVEVVVEQVEPFDGGALPARTGTQPDRFAAAESALTEGPARPLRLDVTRVARVAAARPDARLHLLVRTRDSTDGPILYHSPWSLQREARPRLELMVH